MYSQLQLPPVSVFKSKLQWNSDRKSFSEAIKASQGSDEGLDQFGGCEVLK